MVHLGEIELPWIRQRTRAPKEMFERDKECVCMLCMFVCEIFCDLILRFFLSATYVSLCMDSYVSSTYVFICSCKTYMYEPT
jgi:hypothetical protein